MSSTTEVTPTCTPRRRQKRIPGEEGVWIFILGDMLVFAVLFVVFLRTRSSNPGLFAIDQTELNQSLGAMNTVLLLVSSLFVVLATRAVKSGAWRHLAPRFIVGAWFCGAGFLAIKVVEYAEKVSYGSSCSR